MGAPETKDITEEGINDLKFFSKYACYIAVLAATVLKESFIVNISMMFFDSPTLSLSERNFFLFFFGAN